MSEKKKPYISPKAQPLSAISSASGTCVSGTSVQSCQTGGSNANGTCSTGDGVFDASHCGNGSTYSGAGCSAGTRATQSCTNGQYASNNTPCLDGSTPV
jgi:hypothetical protein